MAVRTNGSLTGLAVLTLNGGEKVGRVQDAVFHAGTGRVTGFLIDGGGLLAKAKFLPAGLVESVGADALTVKSADVLSDSNPAASDPDELFAHALEGRPVVTMSGAALGKVTDTLIDANALTVVALVLATGMLDNALHGRPSLPFALIQTFGKDSLVVPDTYDPKAPEHHAPIA